MSHMFSLNGRRAVVTGAGSGIGRATALALGKAGATVAVNDVCKDGLRETLDLLNSQNSVAKAFAFDVTDQPSFQDAISSVTDDWGGIDIAVSNAGTIKREPITNMSADDAMGIMAVHYCGALNMVHAVLPGMQQRNYGRIIFMGSTADRATRAPMAAYGAAKGALTGFARLLARECGRYSVTVNVIAPGFVKTEMTASLQGSDVDKTVRRCVPVQRWAEPSDVAAAAVFLASDEASYVSGHRLDVNGGLFTKIGEDED